MKTVTIEVTTDGEITVEAHGVRGKGCEALTKHFEEGLGKTEKRMRKGEWYQTASTTSQVKVGG